MEINNDNMIENRKYPNNSIGNTMNGEIRFIRKIEGKILNDHGFLLALPQPALPPFPTPDEVKATLAFTS